MRRYLRGKSKYTIGIDLNIIDLSLAKGKYDDVILADAHHLPIRRDSIEFAVCVDVLDLPGIRINSCIEELERVAKRGIYYHFFNGKIGPMKKLLERYKEVEYIGVKREKDGYRSKYRRFKLPKKSVLNLLGKNAREERMFLKSLPREKFYLGSYIIYVEKVI